MDSFGFFDLVFYILIWLSLGELMIQTQISELSQWMRGAMLLNQPYHSKLESLSLFNFWRKLLGSWWLIATPLIFLIKTHKFISSLVNCPYCLGTWVGLFVNHYYLNLDWITSIILAPMVLVFVAFLDRLHTK